MIGQIEWDRAFAGLTESQHDTETDIRMNDASGIYTWVIATNTIYGDSLFADCFGFSDGETRSGRMLKDILARIHPGDLPRVARAIHEAIVSGLPYQETYRICRPDGSILEVTAFGICFHNAADEPSHFSGIVFPAATESISPENVILKNLLSAHDAAKRDGRSAIAEKIADIMAELGRETAGAARPDTRHLH